MLNVKVSMHYCYIKNDYYDTTYSVDSREHFLFIPFNIHPPNGNVIKIIIKSSYHLNDFPTKDDKKKFFQAAMNFIKNDLAKVTNLNMFKYSPVYLSENDSKLIENSAIEIKINNNVLQSLETQNKKT